MASVLRKMASAMAGGEHKLALVVRQDLRMDKGKTAAQCSHATLACYKAAMKRNPSAVRAWEATGQAKVVLKCKDELEMAQLERKAREHGLVAQSIHDAGRTQVAAGSRTVLGVGPAPAGQVNMVTGKLGLL